MPGSSQEGNTYIIYIFNLASLLRSVYNAEESLCIYYICSRPYGYLDRTRMVRTICVFVRNTPMVRPYAYGQGN